MYVEPGIALRLAEKYLPTAEQEQVKSFTTTINAEDTDPEERASAQEN